MFKLIDIIRYLQFVLFRTKMPIKINFLFFIHHKISQINYYIKGLNNFKKKNIYKSNFFKNGYIHFTSDESVKLAKIMLKKIKSYEVSQGKMLWKTNGRPNLEKLEEHFPELFELFLSEVGDVIKEIYSSDFKIFYAVINKNTGSNKPRQGSQLWHSDGGPGTCLNIMFYLDDVGLDQGPLEIVNWKKTKKLYWFERRFLKKYNSTLSKEKYRLKRSQEFATELEKSDCKFSEKCVGKQGNFIIFSNNTFHRGGYPNVNKERLAAIFHVYPSKKPFETIIKVHKELNKPSSFPEFPDFNELI